MEDLNGTYLPVLIDGDAAREFGMLSAELCAEIGSPLQLPLMVWITPQANPVAWIPLPSSNTANLLDIIRQSHNMVGRIWRDDPSYVSKNSGIDQENRRERIIDRLDARKTSEQPANDARKSLRQLTSLYDPMSRAFDGAGGLFPCGSLDLLTLGAIMDGIPEDLREKCRMVAGNLLEDLITSPMFDPLDGGAYSSRRGNSWALPGYYRDCSTQARIVSSLMNGYSVTGDVRALNRAVGVLAFIEREYATTEGLYSVGTAGEGNVAKWLWTAEELEGILTPDELDLWTEATKMKSVGNLPMEVDPLREYFRANSLGMSETVEDLAKSRNADPKETEELLNTARRKILKVRDERLQLEAAVPEANAISSFRVASAYAAVFSTRRGTNSFLKRL